MERVVTDQGCYEADMVVFGIGFRPNTSLGQGRLRTFGNGAFLVDRRQETSVPGVYAVGDCATVYNNAIQAADYIALATNAVRSGIIAAHNACGKVLESVGVQGSNGISIWGFICSARESAWPGQSGWDTTLRQRIMRTGRRQSLWRTETIR